MRHGSLFSGIGGFDLAAEWMGWDNVFHCEWNPFGQRVLKHYWPKATSYHDITKTDFTIHRGTIDILTGGFPCQPYSAAGKRLGKEDDRHLWPEMLRAVREIQPTYVVGENVRGLTNWNGGMVFDEVQADLEAQGYEVTPFLLPACAVNAPHRRDRIWFIAANTRFTRQERVIKNILQGRNKSRTKSTSSSLQSGNLENVFTNTSDTRLQGCEINGSTETIRKNRNELIAGCLPSTWEKFPTQSTICNGDDGLSGKLDSITFPKWRSESIKAGGNAIVPQVAYEIFKAIAII